MEDGENKPLTYVEAMNGKEASTWEKVMDEEFESLRKNGTWNLVKRTPG